jgi:polyphosphate kinase 2|tara:strand:- start:52164 stop:52955 length:792 start_codon:yes stop_codon:yes gene_type:complete
MTKDKKTKGDKSKSDEYNETLYHLQVELVKLQKDVIANNRKLLIIMEGRDGAGKDGSIKRITEHLSPRETRVVALSKPSDREQTQWYFQRYVPHLPAADEIVIFNRSWYNRAGVEPVMGFCSNEDHERFMNTVTDFEQMLIGSGIEFLKYYLDISKDEQKKRLAARRKDPLKQWKISPIDQVAQEKWADYTKARDEMFARTHTIHSPWTVVHANDKKVARINIIRDILNRVDYEDKKQKLVIPDSDIIMPFDPELYKLGRISE